MVKQTKSQKRSKRHKLSKLLKNVKEIKNRIPTCKGSFAFMSKKDYNRKENKKILKKELSN